jgi:hypothetical protein
LTDNAIASTDNAIASADNAIASANNAIASANNAIASASKNKPTLSFPLPYLKTSPNQTEIFNRMG